MLPNRDTITRVLYLTPIGVCLVCAILLSACQVSHPPVLTRAWNYTDLRALDAVDAVEPGQDLLAAYLRTTPNDLQLRLDFLDLDDQPQYDLWVAVDTGNTGESRLPNGIETEINWDILLLIPASGRIEALEWNTQKQAAYPLANSGVWVLRNLEQDYLLINISRVALTRISSHSKIQVGITVPGTLQIADKFAPFTIESPPPAIPPTLIAFWNCLPAYTPSQALRRWDGAHTGPLGGRHGLANLLRAARNHQMPLLLLDLNTPVALSALEFIHGTSLVQDLYQAGLVSLPTPLPALGGRVEDGGLPVLPAWAISRLVIEYQQTSKAYEISDHRVLYAPESLEVVLGQMEQALPAATQVVITHHDPNSPKDQSLLPVADWVRWQTRRILILPPKEQIIDPYNNATPDGLSLATRHALINYALGQTTAVNSSQALVLGGDFTLSAWGNPQIVRAAFNYINQHPWIHVIGLAEFNTLPPAPSSAKLMPGETQHDLTAPNPYGGLIQTDNNPIQIAAWRSLISLYNPAPPAPPEQLSRLRALYLEQVAHLVEVADWATHPAPLAHCYGNDSGLSAPACILASGNFLALINSEDGSLQYAFGRTPQGQVHQIIAPSSQLISGSGDWRSWNLNNAQTADPQVVPGAFTQAERPTAYQFLDGQLIFSYPDHSRLVYQLIDAGLSIEKSSTPNRGAITTHIPLILDPWLRFTPNWVDLYKLTQVQDGWRWGVADQFNILLKSSQPTTLHTFLTSQAALTLPEDPNQEVPASHYLPLALALAEIQSVGNYSIQIQVQAP